VLSQSLPLVRPQSLGRQFPEDVFEVLSSMWVGPLEWECIDRREVAADIILQRHMHPIIL